MNFKEQLVQDLDVFINSDEFADNVSITALEVTADVDVLEDRYRLQERIKNEYTGIAIGEVLFFTKVSNWIETFGRLPNYGDKIRYNSKFYSVFEATENKGLLEVVLQRGAV